MADYLPNGQAEMFTSNIRWADEDTMREPTEEWNEQTLRVNHPLRVAGDRVYLQGHGFAPAMRVTWPNGESRTSIVQFRPDDPTFFLSSGAMRFDPPAAMYPDLYERRQNQIAIEGLFAPTAEFTGESGALLTSVPRLAQAWSKSACSPGRSSATSSPFSSTCSTGVGAAAASVAACWARSCARSCARRSRYST